MSHRRRQRSKRLRSPEPYESEAVLRHLIVRIAAVAVLTGLAVLNLAELHELRGEMAFARFCQMRKLEEKSRGAAGATSAVQNACAEADWVMLFGRGNPDALWEIAVTCLGWSQDSDLDPMLRLRMGEKAIAAALLAAHAAPSDYEPWLALARAHISLGLWGQGRICLRRAQDLAPPGMELDPLGS